VPNSFKDFIHSILHDAIEFGKTEDAESRVDTEDFILKKTNEVMTAERKYRENIN
jgi:hypothetical protein